MIEAIVEILDHLMWPCLRLMIILDAGRIRPKAPSQLPKLGMLHNRLVMNFRPHLAIVGADRIPLKFVTFYFVDVAGCTVLDPRCSLAVDFHHGPRERTAKLLATRAGHA